MRIVQSIQLIQEVPADTLEYVQTKLRARILKDPNDGLTGEVFDGSPLYLFGDDGNGWYCLWDEDRREIPYFVRYRLVKHSGLHFGRQILVYREPSPRYRGITDHVFFDHLLPRYKALVSDQQQTVHGKRFWSSAVVTAFQKGLHVYTMDRRGRTRPRLQPLLSMDEFRKASPDIWGSEDSDKYLLLVISTEDLSI